MEHRLLALCATVLMIQAGLNYGAPMTATEVYWRAVLPDIPMPEAIIELLHPDNNDQCGAKAQEKPLTGKHTTPSPFRHCDHKGSNLNQVPSAATSQVSKAPMDKTRDLFDYDDYKNVATAGGRRTIANKPGGPFEHHDYKGDLNQNKLPRVAIAQVSKTPGNKARSPFDYNDYKSSSNRNQVPEVAVARGSKTFTNKAGDPFDYDYRGSKKEPSPSPFSYGYIGSNQNEAQSAAMERSKSQNEVATTIFFLEDALRVGNSLAFHFPPVTSNLALLPRHIAESLPFSMSELTEILAMFSMAPDSEDAASVRSTLQSCEPSSVSQETKFCASSLESMIELTMSALRTRDINAKMSTVPKVGVPLQQYTLRAMQVIKGSDFVACHNEAYPYTVYRCHTTGPTRAYMLEMAGELGNMVAVAAVCHTNTSRWNPEHVAFKLLKVKPGTVPVCHIMPYGHMLWARNENRSSG